LCRLDFQRQRIQRTRGGVEMALGEVQIDRGLFQIAVAQQQLDRAQVGTGFEQVSGKAVPQGLLVMLMIRTQRRSAIAIIRSMA
jgi:hypothetical protein